MDHLASFLKEIEQDDRVNAQLLKIRKGAPNVRKATVKELTSTKNVGSLIEVTLDMLKEQLDEVERERLEKMSVRSLQKQPRLGSESPVVAQAPQLLAYIKEISPKRPMRSPNAKHEASASFGYELLANLVQLIGLKSLMTISKPSFEKSNEVPINARILAISANTFGLPLILPLVRTLLKERSHVLCQLGLSIIQHLPDIVGNGVSPVLQPLVQCCAVPVTETASSNAANAAIVSLADHTSPYGFTAFEPIIPSSWSGAHKRKGRATLSYLRSLAAIVPCAPSDRLRELVDPVSDMARKWFASSPDADEQRNASAICSRCAPFVDQKLREQLLVDIFSTFWHSYVDKRLASVVLNTTLEFPVDKSSTVKEIIGANVLVSDDRRIVRSGLQVLAKLKPEISLVLDKRSEERLIDGILATLPDSNGEEEDEGTLIEVSTDPKESSEEQHTRIEGISVHAVVNTLRASPSISVYSRTILASLMERNADPSPSVRVNALKILAGIADLLPLNQLRHLSRSLYEDLGEQFPEVLAEVLAASNACIRVLLAAEGEQLVDPSVGEIITRASPILRNRHEKVQFNCIQLVRTLADLAGEAVPAREWMHICFELLELQKSSRQDIRFDATAAFAAIAAVIGPAYVVMTLINHLRSPDRQFRITTAAAIASVAAETGPFTTSPVSLNEYSQEDIVVQHGVLKTIAFMFEFSHKRNEERAPNYDAAAYVDSLVTLMDDALSTSNQVHRQTAASIIHYMGEACVGAEREAIFTHFLNELMPSIFETSPHVIDRVIEAVNSIRKVIGPSAFCMYLWPGLFHPARKVRNIYWEMWNAMYKDASDALVPLYPFDIPDPLDENKTDIRDAWF